MLIQTSCNNCPNHLEDVLKHLALVMAKHNDSYQFNQRVISIDDLTEIENTQIYKEVQKFGYLLEKPCCKILVSNYLNLHPSFIEAILESVE
jgi:hypothetical protein